MVVYLGPIHDLGSVNLHLATHLRTLRLRDVEESEVYNPIYWISAIFSGLTEPLLLEEIKMNVHVFTAGYHIYDHDSSWSSWSALDTLLNAPQLQNLRKVHIDLRISVDTWIPEEEIKKLRRQLPYLASRGILTIVDSWAAR